MDIKNITFPNFDSIENTQERIQEMYDFCWENRLVYPEATLKIANEALELATLEEFALGRAMSLTNIGFQHWHLSKIDLACEELEEAISIIKEADAYGYLANANLPFVMIQWGLGNREKAFNSSYEAITLLETNNATTSNFWISWALGVFYFDMKDYAKAQELYEKSMEQFEESEKKNQGDKCFILIGLGSVCKAVQNSEKALDYFKEVKQISVNLNQWMQEARAYFEIASIHKLEQNYESAKHEMMKCYRMRKEHSTKPGMISCLIELAAISQLQNDPISKALELLNEAIDLAIETKSKQKLAECHQKLSEFYKADNKFEKAYYHIEEFYKIKTELSGDQASSKLRRLETDFATETANKEAEIHRLINVDLKFANDKLEEKNREIEASIHYAKRIQLAVFPSSELIETHLPDSFLFYKPKEIVGGDFYWMEVVNTKLFFAVADCTGHGVPGALLSVMCSSVLTKAVNELGITKPSLILDKSVDLLEERFNQSGNSVNDGMDISLCCFDMNSRTLEYSGANNSIYYIRDNELNEIKPDKQPIGKYDFRKPFTNHLIPLKKHDQFYLFTDGYADQFGGEKGKKYMYKPLKSLLHKLHKMPLKSQKLELEENINLWKGELDQVDDICILSVKF